MTRRQNKGGQEWTGPFLRSLSGIMLNLTPSRQNFDASVKNSEPPSLCTRKNPQWSEPFSWCSPVAVMLNFDTHASTFLTPASKKSACVKTPIGTRDAMPDACSVTQASAFAAGARAVRAASAHAPASLPHPAAPLTAHASRVGPLRHVTVRQAVFILVTRDRVFDVSVKI